MAVGVGGMRHVRGMIPPFGMSITNAFLLPTTLERTHRRCQGRRVDLLALHTIRSTRVQGLMSELGTRKLGIIASNHFHDST